MIESNSLTGVLIQSAGLVVLGALLVPLVRVLRFQHRETVFINLRSSALWALFAVGAGWVIVMAVFLILSVHAPIDSPDTQGVSTAGLGDAVGQFFIALISVGPILIIMGRRRETPETAGVTAVNFGRSLVVSIPLLSAVVLWYFLLSPRGNATFFTRVTDFWALVQFAIVGFAEEFTYRGYLQTRLVGWLGPYRGWVLASVLMAMAHVGHRTVVLRMSGGEALIGSVSLIPISLFLGFVMLRTQSIVAPALLHTAINWLNP